MFNFLVTQSLKNRLLVLALAAVLIVFGGFTVTKLPVDVFPDLNKPTVTIMTEAEGLAPPEVEQLVSFPIETQMNGLPASRGCAPSLVLVCPSSTWNSTGARTSIVIASRSQSDWLWCEISYLRT